MGLFGKKAAGRVAKKALFGGSKKTTKQASKPVSQKTTEEQELAEYKRLHAKYDAKMQAEWEEYYRTSCDGECETCEYYDWCPDDFEGFEDEEEVEEVQEPEAAPAEELEAEPEPEVELTEEERAAKQAAEAYYADGCDGACETCEHYTWCPAEEETDEDEKVVFAGMTQGQLKETAKGSVNLAKETAMAAKEMKEAFDDITGIFDPKKW